MIPAIMYVRKDTWMVRVSIENNWKVRRDENYIPYYGRLQHSPLFPTLLKKGKQRGKK